MKYFFLYNNNIITLQTLIHHKHKIYGTNQLDTKQMQQLISELLLK